MEEQQTDKGIDRRNFIRVAGAGLTAAGVALTPAERALAQFKTDKDRLDAPCVVHVADSIDFQAARGGAGRGGGGGPRRGAGRRRRQPRQHQERRPARPRRRAPAAGRGGDAAPIVQRSPANGGWSPEQMKAKYGEITMLDFPQFTKDTFPGVTHMDLFSGLFGDVTDDSMFAGRTFDPSTPSGAQVARSPGRRHGEDRRQVPAHLEQRADQSRRTGRGRRARLVSRSRKKWLEGCAVLGVKSMRMNSTSALGPGIRPNAIPRGPGDGYPRNVDIVPMLKAAIESYKEMADYGGNLGIKVTIENHWGLAADPQNIRIILDEVNHPYCEASPDFCNWEHEYMLFHGLKALAPYAAHQRARQVLGPLGRQERRAAIGAHHARRRLQGHLRARVRGRAAERRGGREVSLQGSARRADGAGDCGLTLVRGSGLGIRAESRMAGSKPCRFARCL